MRARIFHYNVRISGIVAVLAIILSCGEPHAQEPQWTGDGAYRLVVEVPPAAISGRTFDERPAQITVNLQNMLQSQLGVSGIPDLRTVQVVRYDATTGQPFSDGGWAYGKSSADRAFRWYDDEIPTNYPEVESYLSDNPNGVQTRTIRQNWGHFFDIEGNWRSGRLAWSHLQQGNSPSRYAIYFDLLPNGTVPHDAAPRGFLGDGGMRTQEMGTTTTGAIETRIDVTDWNGDGLFDIVAGNLRGGISVYYNLGSETNPDFRSSKLLFTTDGKPIDVGWNATPRVVDFDGDGDDDLVTGGQLNRLAWYKNVGSNVNRQFQYMGTVRDAAGQVLTLPTTPNPERPTITADYYPVIDLVDYDNDGARDLIAGGYITGRLYYYKNIGSNVDGTPRFQLQGPIEANGVPIDTEWGAAPTFADFTGDGLFDIVTGTFAINSGVTSDKFLEYYVNVGTASSPAFQKQPIPKVGQFPVAALASPRAVDYNNDGKLDLAVSSDAQIYLYRNIGTTTSPRWTAGALPMPGKWVSSPLFGTQFVDWNQDGHLDKVQGLNVSLNLDQGNPGIYGPASSILPSGQSIPPKPGGGDGWQWLRIFDLDWNGELDILDADHDGKVWLHRNLGTTNNPDFDTTGVVLRQLDGQPIDVGPGPGDPPFDQLQGSRATYSVADFNENGRPDIVIVNFAGEVTYYENETAAEVDPPVFTMPNLVGQLPTRGVPFSADWDGDGDLDILASSDPSQMLFIENVGNDIGGRAIFSNGVWVGLIDAPYDSIGLNILDFNGDGDGDILVDTTHRYTILTDGSFLQHGYANGTVLALERAAIPGDYNRDGAVNAADYVVWRSTQGESVPNGTGADGNGDGFIDDSDIAVWRSHYGQPTVAGIGAASNVTLPEPRGVWLGLAPILFLAGFRIRSVGKKYVPQPVAVRNAAKMRKLQS